MSCCGVQTVSGTAPAGPPGPPGPAGGACLDTVAVAAPQILVVDTLHVVNAGAPVELTFPDPTLSSGCIIAVLYDSATAAEDITWAMAGAGENAFDLDVMRLRIPQEYVEFISNGTRWAVRTDGRIPHIAQVSGEGGFVVAAGAFTIIPQFLVEQDNGLITGTGEPVIARPGLYWAYGWCSVNCTDAQAFNLAVGKSAGAGIPVVNPGCQTRVWSDSPAAPTDRVGAGTGILIDWAIGDALKLIGSMTGGVGQPIAVGQQGARWGVVELLSGRAAPIIP